MDYEFWVYIVASASGTIYVGMTNNLMVRVEQHKSGELEGFAKKYGCSRLVYYEKFDSVFKTIAREKQLKGWRRSKKVALIEKMNPRWEDLAEKWGQKILFPGEKISSK